jgi:hypothetical protein
VYCLENVVLLVFVLGFCLLLDTGAGQRCRYFQQPLLYSSFKTTGAENPLFIYLPAGFTFTFSADSACISPPSFLYLF